MTTGVWVVIGIFVLICIGGTAMFYAFGRKKP